MVPTEWMFSTRTLPLRARLRASRLAWIAFVLAGPALAASSEGTEGEPAAFARAGFVAAELDAAPIDASPGERSAADIRQLPLDALGDVRGKRVADIGAGRGGRVLALAAAVGADGRLFATGFDAEQCAALRGRVDEAGLERVSVVHGGKSGVGLEAQSIDVALLADVYPFAGLPDGRPSLDGHAVLTSLQRALAADGVVVVTYVTSSELREVESSEHLIASTRRDFDAYGFELGRYWRVAGPQGPVFVLEFRWRADGPVERDTYMGRPIARTMHWRGADWLVRAERENEESSREMLAALGVTQGDKVADFGCGNGYHTLALARQVGRAGRVYGVDIQREMLAFLRDRAEDAGIENVETVLGSTFEVPLPPGSCDLILVADVYHELSHPVASLAALRRSLAPGGRIAVLEFRAEDPEVPIKPEHKMSRAQILAEFRANGFELESEYNELPWQHLLFFR